MIGLNQLIRWRDGEAREAELRGEPMFMGKPDAWYDDPHWLCPNGHVSKRFLGTETRGDRCLRCGSSVILGPAMTEDEFMEVLMDL